ncbi:cell division septation protein DedD [Litoreibacter ponti]|uniref:Cell division septation protein DedD n=1 Tax=Litoreibacter ponti TaxID=1510457 RepID=A0A2T6BJV2_9RHOB|nr:SPOR domain-containing protein [Litoreibacter ponti]PTX56335.1 cell division septation protein DedD [Litoreibacter ponti]
MGIHLIRTRVGRAVILLGATALLAACEDGQGFDFLKKKDTDSAASAPAEGGLGSANLIEREVEAPDVFQANEDGLWDGRPSLGGVWVAYPGVKDPERVVIRNLSNNKTVIGALFRRERDNPGPKLQLSSDAAESLGLIAGQPTRMSVVALRTETVPVAQPAASAPISDPEGSEALPAPDAIEAQSLDPIAKAEAAIAKSEALAPGTTEAPLPRETVTTAAAAATPAPAPTRKTSSLAKPFIQIGIFSVKANADNTATSLRGSGILPTVKKGSSQGKTFHRVIVGPATSSAERATLLKKVKALGFNDAYFVTN